MSVSDKYWCWNIDRRPHYNVFINCIAIYLKLKVTAVVSFGVCVKQFSKVERHRGQLILTRLQTRAQASPANFLFLSLAVTVVPHSLCVSATVLILNLSRPNSTCHMVHQLVRVQHPLFLNSVNQPLCVFLLLGRLASSWRWGPTAASDLGALRWWKGAEFTIDLRSTATWPGPALGESHMQMSVFVPSQCGCAATAVPERSHGLCARHKHVHFWVKHATALFCMSASGVPRRHNNTDNDIFCLNSIFRKLRHFTRTLK